MALVGASLLRASSSRACRIRVIPSTQPTAGAAGGARPAAVASAAAAADPPPRRTVPRGGRRTAHGRGRRPADACRCDGGATALPAGVWHRRVPTRPCARSLPRWGSRRPARTHAAGRPQAAPVTRGPPRRLVARGWGPRNNPPPPRRPRRRPRAATSGGSESRPPPLRPHQPPSGGRGRGGGGGDLPPQRRLARRVSPPPHHLGVGGSRVGAPCPHPR